MLFTFSLQYVEFSVSMRTKCTVNLIASVLYVHILVSMRPLSTEVISAKTSTVSIQFTAAIAGTKTAEAPRILVGMDRPTIMVANFTTGAYVKTLSTINTETRTSKMKVLFKAPATSTVAIGGTVTVKSTITAVYNIKTKAKVPAVFNKSMIPTVVTVDTKNIQIP